MRTFFSMFDSREARLLHFAEGGEIKPQVPDVQEVKEEQKSLNANEKISQLNHLGEAADTQKQDVQKGDAVLQLTDQQLTKIEADAKKAVGNVEVTVTQDGKVVAQGTATLENPAAEAAAQAEFGPGYPAFAAKQGEMAVNTQETKTAATETQPQSPVASEQKETPEDNATDKAYFDIKKFEGDAEISGYSKENLQKILTAIDTYLGLAGPELSAIAMTGSPRVDQLNRFIPEMQSRRSQIVSMQQALPQETINKAPEAAAVATGAVNGINVISGADNIAPPPAPAPEPVDFAAEMNKISGGTPEVKTAATTEGGKAEKPTDEPKSNIDDISDRFTSVLEKVKSGDSKERTKAILEGIALIGELIVRMGDGSLFKNAEVASAEKPKEKIDANESKQDREQRIKKELTDMGTKEKPATVTEFVTKKEGQIKEKTDQQDALKKSNDGLGAQKNALTAELGALSKVDATATDPESKTALERKTQIETQLKDIDTQIASNQKSIDALNAESVALKADVDSIQDTKKGLEKLADKDALAAEIHAVFEKMPLKGYEKEKALMETMTAEMLSMLKAEPETLTLTIPKDMAELMKKEVENLPELQQFSKMLQGDGPFFIATSDEELGKVMEKHLDMLQTVNESNAPEVKAEPVDFLTGMNKIAGVEPMTHLEGMNAIAGVTPEVNTASAPVETPVQEPAPATNTASQPAPGGFSIPMGKLPS